MHLGVATVHHARFADNRAAAFFANILLFSSMDKKICMFSPWSVPLAAFRKTKDRLLWNKRPSFALQYVAFWNCVDNQAVMRNIWLRSGLSILGLK